ncbi:aldo/keto reductase (plasmid) [Streptomyces sp. NBC_01281]|uniref:aldo/keto reductase n=1 Tax=Streptomyces sp. NBC_01281 TaxID=2903811 RepID=UPI002E167858|nr:aldo/keto reductase [Streptomyces sp. NBC_01281]
MSAFDLTKRHLGQVHRVHPLGVNCGSIGLPDERPSVTDDSLLDGLRRAVELGATLLDTADSYGAGHAERLLGRLLREYPNRKFVVSSKVGQVRGSAPHPYADRHIHHQFQQTQENLDIEELDLYTLDSWDFGPGDRYLNAAVEQLQTLRDLGAIKSIGMRGPYTRYGATLAERRACAQRFLFLFRTIKPDIVWVRFNGLTPLISLEGQNLFSFTERHRVGVILSAPLAHGWLTGKGCVNKPLRLAMADNRLRVGSFTPQMRIAVKAGLHEVREAFGNAHERPSRLALLYSLQKARHCATVVGFTSEGQVRENFSYLDGPALTENELKRLDVIYSRIRGTLAPDARQVISQASHV